MNKYRARPASSSSQLANHVVYSDRAHRAIERDRARARSILTKTNEWKWSFSDKQRLSGPRNRFRYYANKNSVTASKNKVFK
jgi:hypothetical protein